MWAGPMTVCRATKSGAALCDISFDDSSTNHTISVDNSIQCSPLNRITLGQHKSDKNNQMIQSINVFCVLLRYNGTGNI